MNDIIRSIFAEKQVRTRDGEVLPLHSHIDPDEGKLLFDIIDKDARVCRTLEVGCAYGLSSLHICEALKAREGGRHVIVDPYQMNYWKGVGIYNLERAGFSNFELIEQKSEFALPELASKNEECFDFIFIDGFHTFDHTLVDCFYATRLLSTEGYLVVDDVGFPAVRRVVDYLLNYPCYDFFGATSALQPRSLKRQVARLWVSLLPSGVAKRIFTRNFLKRLSDESQGMVALKKVATDARNWDWHDDDF